MRVKRRFLKVTIVADNEFRKMIPVDNIFELCETNNGGTRIVYKSVDCKELIINNVKEAYVKEAFDDIGHGVYTVEL